MKTYSHGKASQSARHDLDRFKGVDFPASCQMSLVVDKFTSLVPVGPWILEPEFSPLVSSFVRWRSENSGFFFAQVPATIESMKNYLSRYSLGESNRILFVINFDGAHVGHIGISGLRGRQAELDNVMRGETGGRSMMRKSLLKLLEWMLQDLKVDEITLRVKHGNARAIRLYESVGFTLLSGQSRAIASQEPREGNPDMDLECAMRLSLKNTSN